MCVDVKDAAWKCDEASFRNLRQGGHVLTAPAFVRSASSATSVVQIGVDRELTFCTAFSSAQCLHDTFPTWQTDVQGAPSKRHAALIAGQVMCRFVLDKRPDLGDALWRLG